MWPPKLAIQDSVQSFPPPNSLGPAPMWFDIVRGPILPPVGTKQRDYQLRILDRSDYNDLWQGARSGIVKKLAALPFKIDGPPDKVQYYQDVLGYAHFGKGWQHLLKLVLRDFMTQSYGGIFEIAGPGDPLEPLFETPTGLNHLDAGRCYVTGNPIFPVLYYSLWDGKLHRMHASRVYMMVDDPIPDERFFGIGTSALERAISIQQRETRMNEYIDAKLDDKPQPGILSLTGVSDPQWQARIEHYMREQQGDERPIFGRVLVNTSIDPNAVVKAEQLFFSQTPELFNWTEYTSTDVDRIANAIGVDRQEMWELAGRGLGTGSQSGALKTKSRGKLYADCIDGIERFMNWAFLPEDCQFTIDEVDQDQDKAQADIDAVYAGIATQLIAAGYDRAVVAKLLADRSKSFKNAFTDDAGRLIVSSMDPGNPTPITVQDTGIDSHTPTPQAAVTQAEHGAPPVPAPKQLPATAQAKAFSGTATDFEARFADIVTRAIAGRIRRNQAENLLLGLLLSSGTHAFQDGLLMGGVVEMDEDDQQTVQNLVADAIDYLDPFLDTVFDGSLSVDQAEGRASMWGTKTLSQFYASGRLSADANGYYIFTGDDGAKSCPTCQRLKDQVHRFSDWDKHQLIPGVNTENYDCGGFNCHHKLIKAVGPAIGNW